MTVVEDLPFEEKEHNTFVSTLLVCILIAISVNLAHFLKHQKITFLSESAVFILFGFFVSFFWIYFTANPAAIQLDSAFFNLVLLPPIIFEAGYGLQKNNFFQNIVPILGFSIIGAFFSTAVVSIVLWLFSRFVAPPGWSFVESLVFGSLISSTDPVTVLSLLPINVDKNLYILIFGESALNDAVAIILYRFFLSLKEHEDSLQIVPFILAALASFGVFIGSFLVGISIALIFAKLTKHVWIYGYDGAIYELIMLVIFAYGSYLISELLEMTGIISIFFCGIGISHYASPNLTSLSKKTIKVTLRMFSNLCEGIIFLYLGLGLMSFGVHFKFGLIIVAIIAIFLGRTHVYLLSYFTAFIPGCKKIPIMHQNLIYFSGLRGAVAFALAVTFLEMPAFSSKIKSEIFGTSVMTILFTILGLGSIMPYLLKWFKIVDSNAGSAEQHEPAHGELEREVSISEKEELSLTELDLQQPVFGWLYTLDVKYIRPYFSHATEEEIRKKEVVQRLETFRSQLSLTESRKELRMSAVEVPISSAKYKELVDESDSVHLLKSEENETRNSMVVVDLQNAEPSTP